ncbi:phage major capsid protein [Streptosporangium sp. NPDC051022]|uniref:phage major capsid protein n=1 Tax=Streptosporangium sp. NPDC051022 TaxID=3155752 RepID=UPI0034330DF3
MSTKVDNMRVRELKSQLAAKAAEVQRISQTFQDETGNGHMVISTEQANAYRARLGEVKTIKGLIDAEMEAADAFDWLGASDGESIGAQVNAGHEVKRARGGREAKSLSDHFLESKAWEQMREDGFQRLGRSHLIEASVHELEAKDIFTASGGTHVINGFGSAENLGIQERMLRPGRVRDLFPAVRTTKNLIYFMRQTGFLNNARPVPERVAADDVSPATGLDTDRFGRAPRSKSSFKGFRAPIVNIRHMQDAHKNVLDDEPQLRDLLDRDMIDGVKMEEDWQILWGDGDGDNIEGLFNTPGVQQYAGRNTDRRSAQIRRAATQSLLAWFQPTGVVLHPYDWEELELEQDKNGAYVLAVSVALGGDKTVWRMKVVDTTAMAQNKFVLGSWGYGAKLFDRAETTVSVSTENADNVERSAVTIVAESRVGMAVTRPESFVIGSFTQYNPQA